ncbi:hypothetical protein V502_10215 [Pseudogymnoascus sp. VKM F-4520 (FW-2644)]|nr:hypothetical protein V502_10215 [Pseudogymnoascus sp. VKM F-4520 (FW-2644)]
MSGTPNVMAAHSKDPYEPGTIDGFDAVVVTGSGSSAFENRSWIIKLGSFIATTYAPPWMLRRGIFPSGEPLTDLMRWSEPPQDTRPLVHVLGSLLLISRSLSIACIKCGSPSTAVLETRGEYRDISIPPCLNDAEDHTIYAKAASHPGPFPQYEDMKSATF